MQKPIDALESFYDVIVVGARCAGAATGMLLARAGARVLIVERAARGTDTLSTLALMRGGVLQLTRWGLLDAIVAAGTPPIRTTTFHYRETAIEIGIKPRNGVDALYAPKRTLLDPLLADTADAAGADIAYRVRVAGLMRGANGRVNGVVAEGGGLARRISASLVVGADGADSIIAKACAADPYRLGRHMSGVIYTFVTGLDIEAYHWYYVPGASVGVIPTNGGDTLVFAATTRERFMRELRADLGAGFGVLLRETAPALALALRGRPPQPFHGFAGRPSALRPAWGPGWALVGDAGYFKDPITAHGITDALRDAELLAHAVLKGTEAGLREYQAIRDELSVRLFDITDEVASYAWDLPRVQALHTSLSEEMAREVRYLGGLSLAGAAASP